MVTLSARSLALSHSLSLSSLLKTLTSNTESERDRVLCKRARSNRSIITKQWTCMAYLHLTYFESMTFLISPTKTSSPPLLIPVVPPPLLPLLLSLILLKTLTSTTTISLPPPIITPSSTTFAFPYYLSLSLFSKPISKVSIFKDCVLM